MIGITGTLSKAWMHQALGVAFDRDYYFDPIRRHAIDCLCNEYAAEKFRGMGLFYCESNLGRLQYWDKSQVQIGGIQPNMLLGMLLGAEFVPADNRDADITPGCLAGVDPDELPAPDALLHHDLVRLFDDQIARIQGEDRLRPIPPFFWDASGRAAIHGVLTTAQKFYGETIFLDLMTEPRKCATILDWIANAYIVLCRHFAQVAHLPMTDLHVGECSACMISPASMKEAVVPVTSRIAQALGPVRFHSCGCSTHLLEAIAGIDRLQSVDLGGETSIRKAREIFGQEMPISIAPLPRDMSSESPGLILGWARRILEENAGSNLCRFAPNFEFRNSNVEFAGGPLTIVYHLEPAYNVETIRALTEFVTQGRV